MKRTSLPLQRRKFITLLGGAAVAWPLAARAQQAILPLIGVLGSEAAQGYKNRLAAFRQGLSEQGYVEGRKFAFEFRWAEGRSDRLPALAAELVRRKVAVLVAAGTPPALAAKAATSTIPILFDTGGRSGRTRTCLQSQSTGGQSHWHDLAKRRNRGKAAGGAA
jgi:putative ABC transport system substrate-binding protein